MSGDVLPWEDPERLREFALEYVRTGSATTACQRARVSNSQYRMEIWTARLLKRVEVQGYVEQYRAEGVDKPKMVTRESIADDLQEVFERALPDAAYAAAVSAKKTQAEVLGLLEKNVRVTFGRNVEEWSTEDLERELARLQGEGVIALLPSSVTDEGIEVYGD